MILTTAQGIVAKDLHRFRVLDTGRRFGKTTLSVEEMKGEALGGAEKIVYVAPTYQQARDIVWKTLKREMLPIIVGKPNESRLEMTVHTMRQGTCQIMLRGWEAIETLRGQSIDFVVLDEVAMYRNFWRTWQEVIRPCLTDRKGRAMFISTPKGFNHFYDLFNLQESDPDYKSFQFTTYDNPHIPQEEIEKARQELTEDRFAQEYLADFRKMEGLVYKEFNREVHVFNKEEFDNNLPAMFSWNEFLVGVDYGFTNPTAVLQIFRDSADNFYVMDELYERGKTDPETNQYIAALNAQKIFPDPAAASAVAELKKLCPGKVREVVKNKDSIKNGIDRVRELFKANKLHVASHCVNLIQEFETYSYPDKMPGKNEYEDPIKENDHACFSGDTPIDTKYGIKPIRLISLEDQVRTPFGWAKVTAIGSVGIKEVVPFAQNSFVTTDHPIATSNGFVRMDTLRYDSLICNAKSLSSTESNSQDTQTRLIGRVALIILFLKRVWTVRERNSMYISERSRTARFLMDFIFIIRMATRLITKSSTWNVSPAKSIINGITIANLRKLKRDVERTLDYEHAQLLQNGMEPKKGLNSTKELGKSRGKGEPPPVEIATSVGKNIVPISRVEVDSAETIVRQHLCVREEEVYNLETEYGIYYADGVLVSNCDALRYAIMMSVGTTPNARAHQYVPGSVAAPNQRPQGNSSAIPNRAPQYRPKFGRK